MSRVPYALAIGSLMYVRGQVLYICWNNAPVHEKFWAKSIGEPWNGSSGISRYYKTCIMVWQIRHPVETRHRHVGWCRWEGKSTATYVLTLSNGVMSWVSKMLGIVAVSSIEAEYVVAIEACKGCCQWRPSLVIWGLSRTDVGCLVMSGVLTFHARMDHIDISYLFICLLRKDMMSFRNPYTSQPGRHVD